MLMQLAQPLICEARILTSSSSECSIAGAILSDMLSQACIWAGAAAKGSRRWVMVVLLGVTET